MAKSGLVRLEPSATKIPEELDAPKAPKAPKESKLRSGESRLQPPAAELPESQEEGDYLRKYQVRKQTRPGSPESDPPKGSKAEAMKKFLLSQPRVRFFIPRPQGEDVSIRQSVCLNGYRLDFPKQSYVDLPQSVADVLMESLQQTEEALQRNRIDGNKEKEAALS